MVGLIADATGNIRFAFFFLAFMLLLPIPILLFNVDVEAGRKDAIRYSAERDGEHAGKQNEEDGERTRLVGDD